LAVEMGIVSIARVVSREGGSKMGTLAGWGKAAPGLI
jgi:hypothetical protein